jgi:hypothetical protein
VPTGGALVAMIRLLSIVANKADDVTTTKISDACDVVDHKTPISAWKRFRCLLPTSFSMQQTSLRILQ